MSYVPVEVGGRGPALVLCHGFGLAPSTYDEVARLLEKRVRLFRPSLFRARGRWRYDRVLESIGETLAGDGIQSATWVGHSFGGGIALGFAARWPKEVARLVLVDSIGLSGRWGLAREALFGTRVTHLVSWPAARDFVGSWRHCPLAMAAAGWWAYSVDKEDEVDALRSVGIPTDVVWGADDSVLGVGWGRRFSEEVGARLTVVGAPDGLVEHEWVFRRPELFVRTLERLGVVDAG